MVAVTFSLTNGGSAITSESDHGSAANGSTLTAKTYYVRHDGINSITNVKLYITRATGTYSGDATSVADIAELLSWGDASASASFGGVQFNMNASGSFPSTSWPTYDSKSPTGGAVARTGVGDSAANGITLSSLSGCSSDGVVQAGSAPNVRFQVRGVIPSSEDTLGKREWNLAISFDYTS